MKQLIMSVMLVLFSAVSGISHNNKHREYQQPRYEQVGGELDKISDSLDHVIAINDKLIMMRWQKIDSLNRLCSISMPSNVNQ